MYLKQCAENSECLYIVQDDENVESTICIPGRYTIKLIEEKLNYVFSCAYNVNPEKITNSNEVKIIKKYEDTQELLMASNNTHFEDVFIDEGGFFFKMIGSRNYFFMNEISKTLGLTPPYDIRLLKENQTYFEKEYIYHPTHFEFSNHEYRYNGKNRKECYFPELEEWIWSKEQEDECKKIMISIYCEN